MASYQPESENIAFLVERCYFEADQTRVALALDRLKELGEMFPDCPMSHEMVQRTVTECSQAFGNGLAAIYLIRLPDHVFADHSYFVGFTDVKAE